MDEIRCALHAMLYAVKRLALGIGLIVLASALLLITDRGRRTSAATAVRRIAILQHASTPVLDDGLRGVIDGLAARGFQDGGRITIERFNAHGDIPTDVAIARQVTAGGYDAVITASTPALQAVASNNRDAKVNHIFTIVADPFSAGVGLDRADPLKHPPYMVGQSSFPPVDKAFQLARKMLPGLARIGVAWNPAESNSLAFVVKAREVSKAMGLTLFEANVDSSSAVSDATNALVARGAQALWIGGDNTVVSAMNEVIGIGRRLGIPVFTILPGAPDRGTLFDAGPDFYQIGQLGGALAADVLDGADLTRIPVRDVPDLVAPYLSVNTTVLRGLKERWRVPDDVLAEATVVVDAAGVHRKAVARGGAPPAVAAARPLAKTWRVTLVELNQTVDVEEAEKGVLDGLRESGLVEGRDFQKTVRNAQGDMATVSGLVDAAAADSDLLITFSTPTLQAAIQRVSRLPIVFNYVADPVAAGAGTSDTSHRPNVTGVYLRPAYEMMLPILRSYLPRARVLGTIYVPAEVNMVVHREIMERIVRAAGMELKVVAANTSAEVGDAALALVASHVDAICQLPGNLTAAAFPSIALVSRQSRVPIFAFQTSQVRAGAVVAVARDYYASGVEAAGLAARVMRGESPATMPFVGFSHTRLVVNPSAALALGLTTPAAVVRKADEVVK